MSLINALTFLSSINNKLKLFILITFDLTSCVFSIWLSHILIYQKFISLFEINMNIFFVSFLFLPIFIILQTYKFVNRFTNRNIISHFTKSFIFYIAIFSSLNYFLNIELLRFEFFLIHPIIFFILIFSSRLFYSSLYQYKKKLGLKVVIACKINQNFNFLNKIINSQEYEINYIFDYNNTSDNKIISGISVKNINFFFNSIKDLSKQLDQLILIVEELNDPITKEITNKCFEYNIGIKFYSTNNQNFLNLIKNDDLNQKLFDQILIGENDIDISSIKHLYTNRSIIITGAGGSIGSEIIRNLIELNPKKLLLIDSSEINLFLIEKEIIEKLEKLNFSCEIDSFLGSINDPNLKDIFTLFKADLLIHAAAYKHVYFSEKNKKTFLKTNFLGTKNILDLCNETSIKDFLLISTDKAVNSKSYMGYTKRLAEVYCYLKSNHYQNTRIKIVRFGNVLNSSGSVLPTFISQISKLQPIKIYDSNAKRYFMSIKQASRLVLKTLSINSHSFSLFALDMGETKSILNLAKKTINLFGHKFQLNNENKNNYINIIITKLMDNEKTVEELFYNDKNLSSVDRKIFLAEGEFQDIEKEINDIENINLLIN